MMIPISRRKRTFAVLSRAVMLLFATATLAIAVVASAFVISVENSICTTNPSCPWTVRSSPGALLSLLDVGNKSDRKNHIYRQGLGSCRRYYRYVPRRHRSSTSWLPLFYAPGNSAEESNERFYSINNRRNKGNGKDDGKDIGKDIGNSNNNIINSNNINSNNNIINNNNNIINSNLASFCLEIECTIPEFRSATDDLKRRKITLSKERLEVEDEIVRLQAEADSGGFSAAAESIQTTLGSAFSSLWSGTNDNSNNNGMSNSNDYFNGNSNNNSNSNGNGTSRMTDPSAGKDDGEEVGRLEERRKDLSERALAIQNLLASLQWLEDTGVSSSGTRNPEETVTATKVVVQEITTRYRSIAAAEGITIATAATTIESERETETETKTKTKTETPWNFFATGYSYGNVEKDDVEVEDEGAYEDPYDDVEFDDDEDEDEDEDDNLYDEEVQDLDDEPDSVDNVVKNQSDLGAPHPPYNPPTDLQFMKQIMSSSSDAARMGEADSETDDDDENNNNNKDENPMSRIAHWFSKDRIDTNPFQG